MPLNINSEKIKNSITMPMNNVNEITNSMGPHSQKQQPKPNPDNSVSTTTKQRNPETNYLSSIKRYEYEL